jgi:hypothetical protein
LDKLLCGVSSKNIYENLLRHFENSAEIVLMIKESLMVADVPYDNLIARLYLVSDILHNSSLPSG